MISDDEINRKVAEIEGWEAQGAYWINRACVPSWRDALPSYATDWAWCGPLVEKYRVSLTERGEGKWYADAWCGEVVEVLATPQHAICLAVIAAQQARVVA